MQSDSKGNGLFFGTAGWSYPDWDGIVYPSPTPKGFDPLHCLASYLDIVEINSSFYRIPEVRHVERWLASVRTFPDFRFALKIWRGFTHETLLPGPQAVRQFQGAADALATSGRLEAILIQFPWSFKYGVGEMERIRFLADAFGAYPLAIEVRHASWQQAQFMRFLEERQIAFCNIDQPVIGASLPPTARVTAPLGYVRLHGRRYDTWFAPNRPAWERYDYLYAAEEIQEWADRIRSIQGQADRILVITNNHFKGKAVAAAQELRHALTGRKAPAPPTLIKTYSSLADSCVPREANDGHGTQLELF